MPTERFNRLPDKKKEAIRIAAAKEFARVLPEEVSINRIIRDAEISRGSFYTYFEDKGDLLRWLVEDVVDRNMQFYIQRLKENGGDIWDVFDRILDNSLHQIVSEGFLDIFRNLIKSAQFSECLQKKTEQEKEFNAASQQSFDQMYQHLDHESCPVSKEEFYDLMDLQIMLQMMALKSLLQDGQPKETVEKRYKARVRILRYDVGNGKQAERD